jgi:hypothetical protein
MVRLLWDKTVLSLCSRIARPEKGLDRRTQWREEPSHPIVLGLGGEKGSIDDGGGPEGVSVLAERAHKND